MIHLVFRFISGSLMRFLFTTFLILFTGLGSAVPAFGADQPDDSDKTFLLGEFSITGDRVEELISREQKGAPEFPLLSTALRWKSENPIELDIPKEILKHLTQPDLSRILKNAQETDEIDFD